MAKNWVQDIRKKITDTIIKALRCGKLPPWRKPWHEGGLIPRNGKTRKPYSGINVLYLQAVAYIEGFNSNDWFTWKTIKSLKGTLKANEGTKSSLVIYYKMVKKRNAIDDNDRFPMMRYYRVYNRDQTNDLPAQEKISELSEDERISEVEFMVTSLKKHDGLKISVGSQACYYPFADAIEMPPFKNFKAQELYYATLYHEIIHWTGSKKRLNRDMQSFKTDKDTYAYEELVAELGSAFLCSYTKISGDTQPAEYIKSWIKLLENDSKAVFTSSSLAQKAVDYIIKKSGVVFWEPEESDRNETSMA
jgi:antirestriction protein ArdC